MSTNIERHFIGRKEPTTISGYLNDEPKGGFDLLGHPEDLYPKDLITVTGNDIGTVTSEIINPGGVDEEIKFTIKGVVPNNEPTIVGEVRIEATDRIGYLNTTHSVQDGTRESLNDYILSVENLELNGPGSSHFPNSRIGATPIDRQFLSRPSFKSIGRQLEGTNLKLKLKEVLKSRENKKQVVGYVYDILYTSNQHVKASHDINYRLSRNISPLNDTPSLKDAVAGETGDKIITQAYAGKETLDMYGESRDIIVRGSPGAVFWITVVKQEESGLFKGILSKKHKALKYEDYDINLIYGTSKRIDALRFSGREWDLLRQSGLRDSLVVQELLGKKEEVPSLVNTVNRMFCEIPDSGVYKFTQIFPNSALIQNSISPKGADNRIKNDTKYVVAIGGVYLTKGEQTLIPQARHSNYGLSRIRSAGGGRGGLVYGVTKEFLNTKIAFDVGKDGDVARIPNPNTLAGWYVNKYPFSSIKVDSTGNETEQIVTHDLIQRKNIKVSFRLLSTLSATKPLTCNGYTGTPNGSWSPYTGQQAGGAQADEVANFVNLYPDSASANTIIPGVTQNEWGQTMQREFYLTYHVLVSTGLGNSYAITEASAGSSNLIFDALNESGQCSWTNTNPNDNGGTKFIIDEISTEINSNTHEATIKFRVEFISFGSEDVNVDLGLDSIYTWS